MEELNGIIEHVKDAILNSREKKSKLSDAILNMEGMSGKKTRHLYNNIANLPVESGTYLEVGTWKGSSLISAMFKNEHIYCIAIDDFSQFSGTLRDLDLNIKKLTNGQDNHVIVNKNCWDVELLPEDVKINIFMYDGAHKYEDQKRAITHFYKFFSKYVIILVDDWCCDWVDVKRGTEDGIAEMNLKVHFKEEIGLTTPGVYHRDTEGYWNGCGIFVCEKID